MQKNPQSVEKGKFPLELVISIANFLVAAAQIGYKKFGEAKGDSLAKFSKFVTAAVLLVPIFKILHQLRRFAKEEGGRKMNRIKILCMVVYLLALSSAIALLFIKPDRFDIEKQAMAVSMASLLGMVVSSSLLDYKRLPKGNYVDYFIILASLVFAVKLATLFPPLSNHKMAVDIAQSVCMAVALLLPVVHSLLSPHNILEPVSPEDFAMFNTLSMVILVLGIAIVAFPYIQEWLSNRKPSQSSESMDTHTSDPSKSAKGPYEGPQKELEGIKE
ncbi:hypothetical protein M970_060730 [Encephalitozoon cuniculi EcunIII-L]|uniref:Uncharacterized protein n=1 Tax=Encephalitozoon cuniculi TaxID=6035 RepID=M1K9B3_ENCCN|nr:hypothetical protein ECU06_0800 [Encephalitozoon cuniculi]KMV65974.1 hypothetical protein M970_060730 [Encephalitozoon cuniculi EcunIII-L]UYI27671.1 hypothetical protein J0A71_07g15500 [Encephalitozoon cuniculi]